MHAVDPIQRLKLLQLRLDETTIDKMDLELDFHKEMIDIFTSYEIFIQIIFYLLLLQVILPFFHLK